MRCGIAEPIIEESGKEATELGQNEDKEKKKDNTKPENQKTQHD
jgi:hypothetical protein